LSEHVLRALYELSPMLIMLPLYSRRWSCWRHAGMAWWGRFTTFSQLMSMSTWLPL